MNICIVAGARPNFIKVAPIVRAIENAARAGENISCQLVYAGREDDPSLEPSLFTDLQMNPPQFFLGVDSTSLNEITGRVMGEFEAYLNQHPTDVVIVVDDLASTMAAAIVTKKQGIMLAHLVAGTRSFDIKMPKEINRLVIDGLSDLLFTAGDGASNIATREGVQLSQIYKVGNILIDSLRFNHDRWIKPDVFEKLGLEEKKYIVFTLNRKKLIAEEQHLAELMTAILRHTADMPVLAPLRTSAREAVEKSVPASLKQRISFIPPLPYLEFGWLTAHAAGVITDSGNVAEEATFNAVPCITLNSYTEHIETVQKGSNVLVGEDPQLLADNVQLMVNGKWKSSSLPDRWDGRAADRIVQILISTVKA